MVVQPSLSDVLAFCSIRSFTKLDFVPSLHVNDEFFVIPNDVTLICCEMIWNVSSRNKH